MERRAAKMVAKKVFPKVAMLASSMAVKLAEMRAGKLAEKMEKHWAAPRADSTVD